MNGRIFRTLPATALLAGALAVAAGAAQAHATLVSCTIAPNAALSAVPRTLSCTFAEGVNPRGSFVRIFEATGDKAEVDSGNSQVSFTNARQITLAVPKLARGAYAVLWYTVSADDGHKAGGSFSFTVK
jgi:methionine-rich copper-binding protein CopC